jgi:hypothetical protein
MLTVLGGIMMFGGLGTLLQLYNMSPDEREARQQAARARISSRKEQPSPIGGSSSSGGSELHADVEAVLQELPAELRRELERDASK